MMLVYGSKLHKDVLLVAKGSNYLEYKSIVMLVGLVFFVWQSVDLNLN